MNKRTWITIALSNLAIVALLGFLMRGKMLFDMPWLNFKQVLQAHSHFAFGAWVTLSLFVLMVYELLPKQVATGKGYQMIFWGVLLSNGGMLAAFLIQGYALWAIIFSTTYLIVCFWFAATFIRDARRFISNTMVRLGAISALVYLVLSALGPFTLAYLKANHVPGFILYKDAVYTFLHLQYNGFFTLAIVALALKELLPYLKEKGIKAVSRAMVLLNLSVLPTLAISYLWHLPPAFFYVVSWIGAVLLLVSGIYWFTVLWQVKSRFLLVNPTAKGPLAAAIAAFFIKILCLSSSVLPGLEQVFLNRTLIIGFLHLALLMLVSLYLLARFTPLGGLFQSSLSKKALVVFTASVVLNEAVLFTQGTGILFDVNHGTLYNWLLWICGAGLFLGAIFMAGEALRQLSVTPSEKSYPIKHQIINYDNRN